MAKKAKKAVEDEDLDEDQESDESDDEGDEDEAPKSKKGKSKKGKAKKAAKSDEDDEGYVTIQALAEEAEIEPQSARVKLREAELDKPEGGRWRWKDGSKALKEARKALGL